MGKAQNPTEGMRRSRRGRLILAVGLVGSAALLLPLLYEMLSELWAVLAHLVNN